MATGAVQSTALVDSTAPLLLSYGAQRQLGLVLDIEAGAAYSKMFQQHVELVDRDGLPAPRLPLLAQEDFAMIAEANLTAEPDLGDYHMDRDDDDGRFQQQ